MAVKQKIILENPLDSSGVPRRDKPDRRYVKVDEVDRLLAVAALIMTGIRPGEPKGLNVGDLDHDRGRLRVHGQGD